MPAVRYKVPQNSKINCVLNDGVSIENVTLENVSISGIGVVMDSKTFWPKIGRTIHTVLKIADGVEKICEVDAKIIHKTGNVVGLQFSSEKKDIQSFVSDEIIQQLFPSLRLE